MPKYNCRRWRRSWYRKTDTLRQPGAPLEIYSPPKPSTKLLLNSFKEPYRCERPLHQRSKSTLFRFSIMISGRSKFSLRVHAPGPRVRYDGGTRQGDNGVQERDQTRSEALQRVVSKDSGALISPFDAHRRFSSLQVWIGYDIL